VADPHRVQRDAGFDTDTAVGGLTAFSLLGVGYPLAARRATGASPQPSLVLLAHAVGIIALFPVTPGGLGSPLLPVPQALAVLELRQAST
jgi:hypothetical protein